MCWSLLALLCGKWPTSSMEKLLLRDSNACKIQKVCLSSLKPDTARWSCRDQRGGEQPGEHDVQWKLLGPEAADGCGQQDRGECSGQHGPEGRTDHRCWGGGEMGLCVCWDIRDMREGTFSWNGNETLYIMVKQEKTLLLQIKVVQTDHYPPPHLSQACTGWLMAPLSTHAVCASLHFHAHNPTIWIPQMPRCLTSCISQLSEFHKYPDVWHHVLYYGLYCHVL